MEIHLPPEVAQMLQRKIAAGEYHSASDAIAMALLILDDWETWSDQNSDAAELRRLVQEALDDPGPAVSGKEFFAQLREEMAARCAGENIPAV